MIDTATLETVAQAMLDANDDEWCHPSMVPMRKFAAVAIEALAQRGWMPGSDVAELRGIADRLARALELLSHDACWAVVGIGACLNDGCRDRAALLTEYRQLSARLAEHRQMNEGAPAELAPEPRYLLWANDKRMWWRPDGRGYTADVAEAGLFPEAEAVSHVVQSAQAMYLGEATVMIAEPARGAVRRDG